MGRSTSTNSKVNTFTGKVYVVNGDPGGNATLVIGADGSLGAVPGSPVADAITLVGTGGQVTDGTGGVYIQLASTFSGSIDSPDGALPSPD